MKILLALIVALFAASALAQSAARPRPPGTSALEEPPPLPAIVEDPAIETQSQITTRTEGGQTIQEYRINGKLFMTRVTPKHGRSYVMIDHRGDGTFSRMDSLEPGLRVPQWVLAEF